MSSVSLLCTAPNTANSAWQFVDGRIQLSSNPSLCMSPTLPGQAVTLQPCDINNAQQLYMLINSTNSPSATVQLGSGTLGLWCDVM